MAQESPRTHKGLSWWIKSVKQARLEVEERKNGLSVERRADNVKAVSS